MRRRKLDLAHFAFVRAVTEGIPLESAWDRYLCHEAERRDVRLMRSTLRWIRQELSLAARREGRPGLGRLVKIELSVFVGGAAIPSIDQFAEERGLEDWSSSELLALYSEQFPASERLRKTARLIARQIETIHWIERLSYEPPQAGDGVEAWLPERIAASLKLAGIHTLYGLAKRINAHGSRWWGGIQGIGEGKGEKITAWMRESEKATGLQLGHHTKSSALPTALPSPVLIATEGGIVPFERIALPAILDGSSGKFRAPTERCLLSATNDLEAIKAWLDQHAPQQHTWRSYRREAERFLLWCVIVRQKPLSGVTREDCIAYRDFLANPQPVDQWCAPRGRPRWSPAWRPFEAGLSHTAIRQSIQILHNLYSFLTNQSYLIGNPFSGMPLPRAAAAQTRYKRRALTDEEWAFVRERIGDGTPAQRRLGAIFDLLYFTGLRLAGVASVRWGDLERVVFDAHTSGWMLRVTVKGTKEHEVPVPDDVVDSLYGHAADRGLLPPISVEWHSIPLLGRIAEAGFSEGRAQRSLKGAHEGLSQHTIAELVKGHFERCATAATISGDAAMATKLRKASTHWMRHTHATHALASGVELEVVRDNLAHASIATTSIYLTTEQKQRMKAMQGFWKSREKQSAGQKG